MGGGDSKPSTPNSVARDKNDNHSHVNFSHVDEITTPQLSNVNKHIVYKVQNKIKYIENLIVQCINVSKEA
jgi:hypothetical protein